MSALFWKKFPYTKRKVSNKSGRSLVSGDKCKAGAGAGLYYGCSMAMTIGRNNTMQKGINNATATHLQQSYSENPVAPRKQLGLLESRYGVTFVMPVGSRMCLCLKKDMGLFDLRKSSLVLCYCFSECTLKRASPITVGERQAVIEEKISSTRVSDGGRGRHPSGRGGFRGEGFRGRGRFGGGRGFGRNEFRNQGEFSGRPRSSHRTSQNGGGRGGRHGVGNHNVTPSTPV